MKLTATSTQSGKWIVNAEHGRMKLKNSKAVFSMRAGSTITFKDGGNPIGISSGVVETRDDVIEFLNRVAPAEHKGASFSVAVEKFADLFAAKVGYCGAAPVKPLA